jgi:hypothetical protein
MKKNSYKYLFITALVLMVAAVVVYAASVPNVFVPGTTIDANEMNKNFDYLEERSWDLSGSTLYYNKGSVGIGTTTPGQKLTVAGTIESMSGGFKFPDGTVQTTAATGGSGGASIPSGAVMFFNLSSCPTGWSFLAAAQGRYVVGVALGGSIGTTVGTALSSGENRPAGHHAHALFDDYNDAWVGYDTTFKGIITGTLGTNPDSNRLGGSSVSQSTRGFHYTQGATNQIAESGGVAGTPAPYIQLLVCQKV